MDKNIRKRIENCICKAILNDPFFASLMLKFQLMEDTEEKITNTFATDGIHLYYAPEFVSKLNDEQVRTILIHEVMHCSLGHLFRRPSQKYIHILWNVACDHEINLQLDQCNFSGRNKYIWPDKQVCDVFKDPKYTGMSAEYIYDDLIKNVKIIDINKMCQKGLGDIIEDQYKDGEGNPVNPDELKRDWEQSLIQATMAVGKDRGDIPHLILEKIEHLTSNKVNWKSLLRDRLYITSNNDWNWMIPNSRYDSTGFMLPSLKNESVDKIVFALDTSGSMSNELVAEFIAEAQRCLDEIRPEKLIFIQCDLRVNDIKEYEPGGIINREIKGRGGTSFIPVFEHCNKLVDEGDNIKLLIYLTDMEGCFPKEPMYSTIWITNGNLVAPFGETIKI